MLPERADPSTEVFPLQEPSGATPSGAAPLPSWPVRGRQGWIRIDPGRQMELSGGRSAPRREGSRDLSEDQSGRRRSLFQAVRGSGGAAGPRRWNWWPRGAPESRRTVVPAHRSPGAPHAHGNLGRPLVPESRRTVDAAAIVGASVPESRRTGVPAHRRRHGNRGRQCTGVPEYRSSGAPESWRTAATAQPVDASISWSRPTVVQAHLKSRARRASFGPHRNQAPSQRVARLWRLPLRIDGTLQAVGLFRDKLTWA